MTLNKYLDIAPEVQKALEEAVPWCSGIHHHLSRYALSPERETALNVRRSSAKTVPFPPPSPLLAPSEGRLSESEIDYLGKTGAAVTKAIRRDLPILVAEGRTAPPP